MVHCIEQELLLDWNIIFPKELLVTSKWAGQTCCRSLHAYTFQYIIKYMGNDWKRRQYDDISCYYKG
ncbi:hypothetical protein ACS0TY_033099 [Phlomoides rotata]